jgi:hypothetical protein
MARPKQTSVIPPLTNWGGVRSVQRRLERSSTLLANKEAVAYALLSMANTKITDIMSWDEDGNVKVKASHQIPEHALNAIKNVRVRTDKDGSNTLEIELYDKVGVLRLLAKASGLLDTPDNEDRPSVLGINVMAPDVTDVEPDDIEGERR